MGIITMLCSLLGCTAQTKGFESIGAEKFEQIIADTAKVIRLDVRTAEEYAEGHIDGAMNIDVLKDDFKDNAITRLPKDKTIAVYWPQWETQQESRRHSCKAGVQRH